MALNRYEHFLSQHFRERNVFLTGIELVALMRETFSVTADNARKIIERAAANGVISSSKPLTFGKRQYVYFAPGGKITLSILKKIAKKYRPPLYRLLQGLSSAGVISVDEAAKYASTPSETSTTKVSSLSELAYILTQLNLVVHHNDGDGNQYLALNEVENRLEDLVSTHKVNLAVDATFIPDLIRWLQCHNIIDNTTVTYKNKLTVAKCVVHNNIVWDAFAYTSTTGYSSLPPGEKSWNDAKTVVVMDVVVHRDYELYDLHGFYDRIQILRHSTRSSTRKVLPIVFLAHASKEVMKELRDMHILSFSIGTVYGEKIYDIVNNLKIISTQEKQGVADPDRLVTAIESALNSMAATGQESNLQNIKGDLFEALMYPVFKDIYPNSDVRQSQVVKQAGSAKKYEYDVVIISSQYKEIVVVELKGYKSTSTIPLGDNNKKNTVSWFFKNTLPHIQSFYSHYEYPVKGAYIATCGFDEPAIAFMSGLMKSKLKSKRLDIFYDNKKLIDMLDGMGLSRIKNLISKYYA